MVLYGWKVKYKDYSIWKADRSESQKPDDFLIYSNVKGKKELIYRIHWILEITC